MAEEQIGTDMINKLDKLGKRFGTQPVNSSVASG